MNGSWYLQWNGSLPLDEPGNLTSFAMMGSMACITMMMQWVMDMMNHTYVSGWKVTVNTEYREELSREGDDSIIYILVFSRI